VLHFQPYDKSLWKLRQHLVHAHHQEILLWTNLLLRNWEFVSCIFVRFIWGAKHFTFLWVTPRCNTFSTNVKVEPTVMSFTTFLSNATISITTAHRSCSSMQLS
jgi:hypothetical protein